MPLDVSSNYIGSTFGRLTIINDAGKASNGDRLVSCSCVCGNIKTLRRHHVLKGNTISCGCAYFGHANARGFKHTNEFKEALRERLSGKPLPCSGWNRGLPMTTDQKELRSKQMLGKHNPQYIDGRTSFTSRVRRSFKNKYWRNLVFQRDNWTCLLCKERGGYLEVDHYPMAFSEILTKHAIKTYDEAMKCKALWDIDNGRTLCRQCHDETKV